MIVTGCHHIVAIPWNKNTVRLWRQKIEGQLFANRWGVNVASQVHGFQNNEFKLLCQSGSLFACVIPVGVAIAKRSEETESLLLQGGVCFQSSQRCRCRLLDIGVELIDRPFRHYTGPTRLRRVHCRRGGHESARICQEIDEREAQQRLDCLLLSPRARWTHRCRWNDCPWRQINAAWRVIQWIISKPCWWFWFLESF